MEILDSLEVRWFFANDNPVAVAARKWFESTSSEGKRTDDYLFTGRDDLGFKARAVAGEPTKVETKYLLGSLGIIQIAPGVKGRLERWRKLSLALDDKKLQKDGRWIAIEKDRRLRKFAFDPSGVNEVPVKSRPDAGCGVEITELRCTLDAGSNVRVACTLGLEAFGPDAMLLDALQVTCRETFGKSLLIQLVGESSMSYPAWLRGEDTRR